MSLMQPLLTCKIIPSFRGKTPSFENELLGSILGTISFQLLFPDILEWLWRQCQQGIKCGCLKDNPLPVGLPRKGFTFLCISWGLLLLNHRSPSSTLAKQYSGSPCHESQQHMRGSAHVINFIAMPALHLLTHSHKSLRCAVYVVNSLKGECVSMYGCVWELFEIPYDLPTHWALLQYWAQSSGNKLAPSSALHIAKRSPSMAKLLERKENPPTSEFMTLDSACALFLCMPEWHGNSRKSVWPVSMLSHLQLRWIFPFF